MKLAEALILRADYQKRIEQMKNRLLSNAKVQEGEKPAENPNELLKELDIIMAELTELIQRINKTNCNTYFDNERMLVDMLAVRENIWNKRSILSSLAESAVIKLDRYSRSEVKFISMVNVAALQKEIEKLSKEFRELDTKIQEKNWTVSLL